MKTYLKWLGNKNRLTKIINEYMSPDQKLVDVFCGSGAVTFNSVCRNIVMNDVNKDLMRVHYLIKHNIRAFQPMIQMFRDCISKEAFFEYRKEFNTTTDLERKCCIFILLNKYSFNGLVRYNQKGQCSSSWGGREEPIHPPVKDMKDAHLLLKSKNVCLQNMDFRECIEKFDGPNTFFFMDPPYFNNFDKYATTFTQQDHIDLCLACQNIKGSFLLCNSDDPTIRDLYKEYNIRELKVHRSIQAGMAQADELLISNVEVAASSFAQVFDW